ncbi:hypothetical protein PTKIN_Ptkin09bG0281600 [Pterospermum kingtungense]
MASRGKFARLCVEVDITKPLLSRFKLRRRVRRIEYEGIHLVCFQYGIYRHCKDTCPQNLGKEEGVVQDEGENLVRMERNSIIDRNQEVVEAYGPWMLVNRRNRRLEKKQETRSGNEGKQVLLKTKKIGFSFFAPLENMEGNENDLAVVGLGDNEGTGVVQGSKLPSRGKRPVVQITEKEVLNVGVSTSHQAARKEIGNIAGQKDKVGVVQRSNQAAAEDEHTVVLGSQGCRRIERIRVGHSMEVDNVEEGGSSAGVMNNEHHQDPLKAIDLQRGGVIQEDGRNIPRDDGGVNHIEVHEYQVRA